MAKNDQNNDLMEKIVSLTKRRGFIFPSSEIYGGFGSSYDYGPIGAELKNNVKQAWWDEMTKFQDNIVGLNSAVLMSPKVWEASGHLTEGFADMLAECKKCKRRFREDHIEEGKCPECGSELSEGRKFNLMMKTFIGSVEDKAATAYLRAETCQGIFINFENVRESMRMKIPFGIAQIGKAFRNEITPGNFTYRTREFDQMEMQFFVHPDEADKWFDYWKDERLKWYLGLGIKKENIRIREQKKDELAHYAKKAVDIEYRFPFGWQEIEGIHNRGDWDLSNHSKHSGKDLSYADEKTGKKFIPYVIETSAGADRSTLTFLINAYEEISGGRTTTTESIKEKEVVLRLNKKLSPVKVAILPLSKKEELAKKTRETFDLIKVKFESQYDETGSIGKRYRRHDEIGTPYCVTVDFETLEDNAVTVRDRDTMKQERIKIKELTEYLSKKLSQ
ncbi:glycine--tRNA ligase [bacterium BMS3Abin15]|nr:glycine--tRNA ligase [bacterium BMS3Abin15]